MTVTRIDANGRRAHQQRVSALLDELEEQRRHLYRLKAAGARRAGMRGLKSDLESTRLRLLDTVAHPPPAADDAAGGGDGSVTLAA
jgi:hypothetical protein